MIRDKSVDLFVIEIFCFAFKVRLYCKERRGWGYRFLGGPRIAIDLGPVSLVFEKYPFTWIR